MEGSVIWEVGGEEASEIPSSDSLRLASSIPIFLVSSDSNFCSVESTLLFSSADIYKKKKEN